MAWNIGTASRVEVTMICDSTIDTLYMDPPGVSVKRLGLGHAFDPAKGMSNMPVADNCSCMLVKVYALETNNIGAPVPYTILFDCGGTPDSFIKNMKALEVDPMSINQVVISHGHPDHMGALKDFMELDRTADEMAIAINLRGHGLVVLSGCAHNGIINTIKRCQEVSDIQEVYAVIGGFHLGFPEVPRDMPAKTIEKLKEIAPKVIIPQHCTGFRASADIMNAFPEEYVQTSAGMTVCMPFVKHAHPEMLQAALAAKKAEMMKEAGYRKQGE